MLKITILTKRQFNIICVIVLSYSFVKFRVYFYRTNPYMKYITRLSFLAVLVASNVHAAGKVSDEASLIYAFAMASDDSSIGKIEFEKNAQISLTSPVIYNGTQNLSLEGNGATLDGAGAGIFDPLTAVTTDGTLIFNTAGDITIKKLTVINSATRGIVVNIPGDAQGDDIQVKLYKVKILGSALYGLHIDDNADEFDEGAIGSVIGIELSISHSSFIGNGTGAIDFDGIRVDERAQGDIHVMISDTHIDGNGGDGIELDEAGEGNVDATMKHVTINDNGLYNANDLDDGFDIDEADSGDIEVSLFEVQVKNNGEEGLDFDEAGDGSVELKLRSVTALDNANEGIKVDEQDAGNIEAKLFKVEVRGSGDDGIQFTELGTGKIEAKLNRVSAIDNAKYGVKMEQWDVEDAETILEDAGSLKVRKLSLSGNDKGDKLKLNNIDIK